MLLTHTEAAKQRASLDAITRLVEKHENEVLAASFSQIYRLLEVHDGVHVLLPEKKETTSRSTLHRLVLPASRRRRLDLTLQAMPIVALCGYTTEVVEYVLAVNPFEQLRAFIGAEAMAM